MPDDDLGAQLVDLIDGAADPVMLDEVRARGPVSRRRNRVGEAIAIALVIFVPIAAAVFIVRERNTTATDTPATVATTPTSAPSGDPVDSFRKLPASAVEEFTFPEDLQVDNAFVADGELWVTGQYLCRPECPPAPTLYRLDQSNGTFDGVPGYVPVGIDAAYADGSLYVLRSDRLNGNPYQVARVDIPSGDVRYTVDVPDTHVFGNTNPRGRIAVGFGSVWVYDGRDSIARLDAETGQQTARIPLPPNTASNGLAVNAQGVWSVAWGATSVWRVDPDANKVAVATNFAPGFAQSIAADDDYVWTTNFVRLLRLYRIEELGPALFDVEVTDVPTADVASGDGGVWFLSWVPGSKADSSRNHPGVVGQIDPETLQVTGVSELPIGTLDETQLVVGDGAAWVVDSTTHRVWRIADPS